MSAATPSAARRRRLARGPARARGRQARFWPSCPVRRRSRASPTCCAERGLPPQIELAPLYGALERGEQDRAVAPAARGRRKIVLATSIAETSLTIEGVRVVIDCGLARVPRFEPDLGLTRLETVRASRANADQRRGRAGRVEPGVCYRLWEEAATGALPAFATPRFSPPTFRASRSISPIGASAIPRARLSGSAAARRLAEALALCRARRARR